MIGEERKYNMPKEVKVRVCGKDENGNKVCKERTMEFEEGTTGPISSEVTYPK